jgi:hypothetical protein
MRRHSSLVYGSSIGIEDTPSVGTFRYVSADVFTDTPLAGNGLAALQMQAYDLPTNGGK